jgi:hypothetical protein
MLRLLIWLHRWLSEWHSSEVRKQEDREWEVRDRNRRRRWEAEGGPREVSEDAWSQGEHDGSPNRFKKSRKRLKWDIEKKPGKSAGLVLSRSLLILISVILFGFIAFGGCMFLLIIFAITMGGAANRR